MTIVRSILLFLLAAVAEIGGAWLVWQGWREDRGLRWIAAGVLALGAYGGVFVAGSLAWGVVVDKPLTENLLGPPLQRGEMRSTKTMRWLTDRSLNSRYLPAASCLGVQRLA